MISRIDCSVLLEIKGVLITLFKFFALDSCAPADQVPTFVEVIRVSIKPDTSLGIFAATRHDPHYYVIQSSQSQ